MDRPWFCSAYAAAGYFMCDPLTNVPKWCQYNLADIWCPDDPGYEYDGTTGQGGSSGGAGASRIWTQEKCFDSDYKEIPCRKFEKRYDDALFVIETNQMFLAPEYSPIVWKVGEMEYREIYMNDYITCVDKNNYSFDCDYLSTSSAQHFDKFVDPIYNSPSNNWSIFGDGCFANDVDKRYVKVPCMFNVKFSNIEEREKNFFIDDSFTFRSHSSGITLTPEGFDNGYPIYVPPVDPENPDDPFNPDYPETTEECASIICQCISFVVKALQKVDQSVLQVVAAVKDLHLTVPDYPIFPEIIPFDSQPLMDKLDEILTVIDNISLDIIKEAETNFWDVLGGAFSDIFELIEFLIDKIIYLIVPENTDNIVLIFENLIENINTKFEPVDELQRQFNNVIPVDQREIQNVKKVFPLFGTNVEVTLFNFDYLNMGIPMIRMFLGAIMIIWTTIWAYRKISSEMIR